MSKASIKAPRRKSVPYLEFMARYESEPVVAFISPVFLQDALACGTSMAQALTRPMCIKPLPPVMDELKHHAFFELLRAANKDCPEAFTELLYLWLFRMGVVPPGGVFTEMRGKVGRPRNRRTDAIFEKWIEIGTPSLGCRKLAYAVYGREFTNAVSAERKKMVDRCRRAVERHQVQFTTNSSPDLVANRVDD